VHEFRTADEELKSIISEIHKAPGVKGTPRFTDRDSFLLDGKPFRPSGARSVNINSRGYDEKTLHLWHRPEDLPETVHLDCVENSFLVFTEYINRLQNL